MLSWMTPYRPDPFKFRPTRIKLWLYWFFYLQNQVMMRGLFKFQRPQISAESRQRLKALRKPGVSNLLVANHINFADPHVAFHLAFVGGYTHKWLAGIEPFDSGRGITGWFIQSVGAFSVDRGILDRYSLETCQTTLVEGKHPLVVYPEGEADYTHKIVESFYPGAAQFALSAAEQLADSPQPVRIHPIGISFRLAENAQEITEKAMADYAAHLAEALPVTTHGEQPKISPWQRLMGLIEQSVTLLESQTHGFTHDPHRMLEDRMLALREFWLESLFQEHYNETFPGVNSQDELMITKNKLRTLIARKRHAPPVAELDAALQEAKGLSETFKGSGKCRMGRLKKLETQWIGEAQNGKPLDKRVKQLEKHLQQQKPFADIRAAASPADLIRWDAQINMTRQVKMMTLLLNDIRRCDTSWDALEESIVKLEILVFSKFRYRGPKRVEARVGEPLDVKAFVAEHAALGKKGLLELLNNTIRQSVADLVDDSRLEPPIPVKALVSSR